MRNTEKNRKKHDYLKTAECFDGSEPEIERKIGRRWLLAERTGHQGSWWGRNGWAGFGI